MFSFSTVFAAEKQIASLSYQEYEELKANNYIGEDISYDYLKELIDQSKKLEETLDNNTTVFHTLGKLLKPFYYL